MFLCAVLAPLPGTMKPAAGAAADTDRMTADYWRAVSMINLGRKSRFEHRKCAAWGEFAGAHSILSDIRRADPDFQRKTLVRRMRACEVAMKQLSPSLPDLDRRLYGLSEAVSAKVDRIAEQEEELFSVVKEIRDSLELLGKKEAEAPGEAPAAAAVDEDKLDADNDGLTNAEEASNGTDIASPDTDGDGLGDFHEVKTYGTNPTAPDTDGDGLTDSYEVQSYTTDPLDVDTDSDDLEDGQEQVWGTDPNNPDTDGDGDTDGEEVKAGYDPLRHYPDDYWETGEPPE